MTDTLTNVLTEYYTLLQEDHHKDRDCHFEISKRWSYGKPKGYYIRHDGYCNKVGNYGYSEDYSTYEEAKQELIKLVSKWIEEEKQIKEDELQF